MSELGKDQPQEDKLFEEAAAWFARMRGPDAQQSRIDFEAWLGCGAPQRAAYNRAAEIFAMGKVLGEAPGEASGGSSAAQRPARGKVRLLVPGLAGLAIAAALVLRPVDLPRRHELARQRREAAEILSEGQARQFGLADGSIVQLARGSRLDIAYDSARRELTLKSGEARFHVAHERRPFIVLAGGGTVTAHGTIFDVGLSRDHRVSVHLIEGIIDVKLPSPTKGKPQTIHQMRRGESLTFVAVNEPTRGAASGATATPLPSAQILQHTRDYDQVPLAELITDANERSARPIRLADPAIGAMRVSGRFSIGDTELLADRIAALFSLAVDREDRSVIILKRKSRSPIFLGPTP